MKISTKYSNHSIGTQLSGSNFHIRKYLAKASSKITGCFSQIVNVLTDSSDIRVEQKRDRSGQYYWYVYNRSNGQSAYFSTEKEVRAWLDSRYYQ